MAKKRRRRPKDSNRYYDWLERAAEDLTAAQILLKNSRCRNVVAFHCQQAIEKALKAYILMETGQRVDGHNLTWLCRQAQKRKPSFGKWLDESAQLNHYYVETRYPTDIMMEVSEKEVAAVFAMAAELYVVICAEIDMYEEEEFSEDEEMENR